MTEDEKMDKDCKVDFNADDFLMKARMEAREELTSQIRDKKCSYDLPQLLQMSHALIATNHEIWERCKGHRDQDFEGFFVSRISFQEVFCKTVECARFIEVSIKPQYDCWEVGAPPTLLPGLLDVVPATGLDFPSDGKFQGLPNYHDYMKKAVRLEDDVLVPFLHMFMEHLESLQVFLGEIESWITGPVKHAAYLEDLFGSKIIVPEKLCSSFCSPTCQLNHHLKSLCSKCKQPFMVHTSQHWCHPNRTNRGSFMLYEACEIQVLLRRPHTLGNLDFVFDLDSDDDQKRLWAFTDFIFCTESGEVL